MARFLPQPGSAMRVVYVCADPEVPVFGSKASSVQVQVLLQALMRRGASVDLLATRAGGRRPRGLNALRVHRLPSVLPGEPARREQAALAANAGLAATVRGLGSFDLVYERASRWSHAALEYGLLAGIPVVLEVDGPLGDERAADSAIVNQAAADAVADRQADCATLVVTPSEPVAELFRVRHPAAADRVRVVPKGIDPERFPGHLLRRRAAAGRPFTVGFRGALEPSAGVPALLEAFEMLRAIEPHARLLVVGEGSERGALATGLAGAGLDAAATLTGAVPAHRVPALLAVMDVGVAPFAAPRPSGLPPFEMLEMMAAGLPVVATRMGGVETWIQHRRTGILVDPGDSARLAEALIELALRPLWRVRVGTAARRVVAEGRTSDAALSSILHDVRRSAVRTGEMKGFSSSPH